ncbi:MULTISPECIES: hypothetical protein [unclassified Desulfovibrio]|uniref:hypothetical protein n=1 Tax=unclassified Desulfovibrio TaxID=2593640 RepID=UPI000F5FFAB6|nr:MULTISPECIES: hypothetical protein [unclassified Desulfovibrio]RRD70470.1 hypothetical protein EII24_06530 [Desulfovibrio sp. OH1209_COT-279]RRD86934.1 hypothetical protein EII23_06530 [Desulfovibrio sp. OH1186_COT-070]
MPPFKNFYEENLLRMRWKGAVPVFAEEIFFQGSGTTVAKRESTFLSFADSLLQTERPAPVSGPFGLLLFVQGVFG